MTEIKKDQMDNISFRGKRNESEIRAALRNLMNDGLRFDETEFIMAGPELLSLSFEITRLYNIPCTFDPGVPLHYSKAARTVNSWLRWLADDYGAQHLIRMMYDGIPAPQEVRFQGERGGRLQMAALLRRAGIERGRDQLLPAVDRYIVQLKAAESTASSQRSVLQALANRGWLELLLDITPLRQADGLYSLHEIAAAAEALVLKLCRDAYPGEALALTQLAELMTEIQQRTDIRISAQDAAESILKRIRKTYYPMVLQSPGSDALPTIDPLPGHLHVSLPDNGGRSGRKKTFLLGFDAGFYTDPQLKAMLQRCRGEVLRLEGESIALPPLSLAEWWLSSSESGDTKQLREALNSWYPLHRAGMESGTDNAAEIVQSLGLKEPPPWKTNALAGTDKIKNPIEHKSPAIPELLQLMDILRALTDPENPLPVVAFLCGPLCGADVDSLLAYQRAGGEFAFNTRAIPGTDERIARGLQFLKDTVRLVRSNPPGTVIASVIERLALHAVIAVSPSGRRGVEALRNLLALVQHWSATGHSIPEIVMMLEESEFIAAPLSSLEQSSDNAGRSSDQEGDSPHELNPLSAVELAAAATAAEAEILSRFEHASLISEA
ncbi:MAG: hypothetical protein WAV84_13710 [Bacteroidota bacterium]